MIWPMNNSHLIPYLSFPYSFFSSHIDPLAGSWTLQANSLLWSFQLVVLSVWNDFPLNILTMCFLFYSNFCSHIIPIFRPLMNDLSKVEKYVTPISLILPSVLFFIVLIKIILIIICLSIYILSSPWNISCIMLGSLLVLFISVF